MDFKSLFIRSTLASTIGFACGLASAPLAMLPCCSSASAQFVFTTTGAGFGTRSNEYTDADFKAICKILGFSDDQKQIAKSVFDDYRNRYVAAYKEMNEKQMQIFKSASDDNKTKKPTPSDWQAVSKKVDANKDQWNDQSKAMADDLVKSIQALSTKDQLTKWPLFEMDRRRRTELHPGSTLAGEGVDLIALVDSMKLDDDVMQRLSPELSQYSADIDSAIKARSTAEDKMHQATKKAMDDASSGGQGFSSQTFHDAQKAVRVQHANVRDVNLRHVDLITSLLAGDLGSEFHQDFMRKAFPAIYRPTAADTYLSRVQSQAGLTNNQTASLKTIEADYNRQVDVVNQQLADDQIKSEADGKAIANPNVFTFGGDDDSGPAVAIGSPASGDDSGPAGGTVSTSISLAFSAPADSSGGGGTSEVNPGQLGGLVFGGGDDNPPADSPRGKLLKTKSDIVNQTIDSAFALLNPEQQKTVPAPTAEERLSPAERTRRQIQKAFNNAKVQTDDDGNKIISVHVDSTNKSDSKGSDAKNGH